MTDLLDLVRSIAAAAARADENKHYPAPCGQGSPLLANVRQACVERGYTADGLAVPGMAEDALSTRVPTHQDVKKALLNALKSHSKAVETEHLHARSIGSGGPGELRKADFARRNTEAAIRALAALVTTSVQPVAVPDGWKPVPVRMTPEMKSILKEVAPKWNAESIYGNLLEAAPTAPAAQGDAKDTCAKTRALCSACGGTGDMHGLDGKWRGQCTCVHAWQQRAEKAEADLKQVNEWRAAALAENMQSVERWAKRIAELEVKLARRGAQLSPETKQAIAAARAAGQSIAATPASLIFMNDSAEPGSGELDCPACGGSGHAGDVAAGSTP